MDSGSDVSASFNALAPSFPLRFDIERISIVLVAPVEAVASIPSFPPAPRRGRGGGGFLTVRDP